MTDCTHKDKIIYTEAASDAINKILDDPLHMPFVNITKCKHCGKVLK